MRPNALAFILVLASFSLLPGCKKPPCGNDQIDEGEECDGAGLGEASCASLGFSYGTLACTASCSFETSGCVLDPTWSYPFGPFGTDLGEVVENLGYEPANAAARALAGEDGRLSLGDLWGLNEQHGGPLTGLMVFVSAGWCPYCADEARELEEVYQQFADRGIMLLGLLTQDNHGERADVADAQAYADKYDWTFPAVAGSLDGDYWYTAESRGSVPLHFFVDLRNMRLSGRIEGAVGPKMLRIPLEELSTGIAWSQEGERVVDFDCAPGSGTEVEPNDVDDSLATLTLPAAVSGTICPPIVAEGPLVDEDYFDLGELTAGTALEVTMEATAGGPLYPGFFLMCVDELDRILFWQASPVRMDGAPATRQWLIPEGGHYLLVAQDYRLVSHLYYGVDAPPESDQCCEGGPSYNYSLQVDNFALAATEPPIEVGVERHEAAGAETVKVYPLAAVSGTEYAITMRADISRLDPSLVLYDSVTGSVLAFNEDIDGEGEDYDSRINWTATTDNELWIVAGYSLSTFTPDPPMFRLRVELGT